MFTQHTSENGCNIEDDPCVTNRSIFWVHHDGLLLADKVRGVVEGVYSVALGYWVMQLPIGINLCALSCTLSVRTEEASWMISETPCFRSNFKVILRPKNRIMLPSCF